MELTAMLGKLLRHRWAVALGLLVALAAAWSAYERSAPSAVTTTRVVLDTVPSQLTSASSPGTESLRWRASLLAALMTTTPARRSIARGAGIPPESLLVSVVDPARPASVTALPTKALEAASLATAPYAVTITAATGQPVLHIAAAAGDTARASALARATVATLARTGASAPDRWRQPISVRVVSPATPDMQDAGHGILRSVGLGAAVALLWLWVVVLLPEGRARRPRAWRAVRD